MTHIANLALRACSCTIQARRRISGNSPASGSAPHRPRSKYTLPGITNPAKLCINMLRSSHMHMQVRLSKEAMINLTENRVPHSVFKQLLHESLNKVNLV